MFVCLSVFFLLWAGAGIEGFGLRAWGGVWSRV